MRKYTYNWGKLLFFRWIVASWLLHGVHVFDKTEKYYYILCEMCSQIFALGTLFAIGCHNILFYILSIIVIHTITWLLDSHWLVGYREVDTSFHSRGISSVIEYSNYVKKEIVSFPSVKMIGLYGSMSRRMFHDRSDLDLRIVQDSKDFLLFLKIQKLRFIGIWKYKIPLDLKLVDSFEFLRKEMRVDEKAIVIYKSVPTFYNEGVPFAELESNPSSFLRENNTLYTCK